jgi:PLP dependent protein
MYGKRLRENLPLVLEGIERAKERSGRSERVRLVVVTKGHPPAAVEAVIAAGLTDCAENRVQEFVQKVETIGQGRTTWHMVGHLQRNKVRQVVPLCDLMQSVDSLRLARELSREGERTGADVDVLVQVNTSGELQKGGFRLTDAGLGAVTDEIAEVAALPRLRVLGLMTMAPLTSDEAVLRQTFAGARRLFDACTREVRGFEPRHLSMGMSNDFEIAVEEGSTMLRLGTALLGEREA